MPRRDFSWPWLSDFFVTPIQVSAGFYEAMREMFEGRALAFIVRAARYFSRRRAGAAGPRTMRRMPDLSARRGGSLLRRAQPASSRDRVTSSKMLREQVFRCEPTEAGPSLRTQRSNPEPWGGPFVAASLRSLRYGSSRQRSRAAPRRRLLQRDVAPYSSRPRAAISPRATAAPQPFELPLAQSNCCARCGDPGPPRAPSASASRRAPIRCDPP